MNYNIDIIYRTGLIMFDMPRQIIPKTTRTQGNSHSGQPLPKTTRTQYHLGRHVPKTTRTQQMSYPG